MQEFNPNVATKHRIPSHPSKLLLTYRRALPTQPGCHPGLRGFVSARAFRPTILVVTAFSSKLTHTTEAVRADSITPDCSPVLLWAHVACVMLTNSVVHDRRISGTPSISAYLKRRGFLLCRILSRS